MVAAIHEYITGVFPDWILFLTGGPDGVIALAGLLLMLIVVFSGRGAWGSWRNRRHGGYGCGSDFDDFCGGDGGGD